MEIDRSNLNPAQRRVLERLLAVGDPRPPHNPQVPARIRALVEGGTAAAAAAVPAGDRGLFINKGSLDALECDGRYLDRIDSDFSWSPAMVRGTLAHEGIAVDLAGGGRHDPAAVVHHAWNRFTGSGRPAGTFAAELGTVEAEGLRAEAQAIVTEFREVFPPLPGSWHPRVEAELRVSLHRRRVTLLGKPDLLVGRATTDRRRMLLVDLKSGQRREERDRADMRFYALLATLKYGIAPFRVATFYLAEADWDHEDIDGSVLEAAARNLLDKVTIAARLEYARPADTDLRLVPGPACSWCLRSPTCAMAPHADRDLLRAH